MIPGRRNSEPFCLAGRLGHARECLPKGVDHLGNRRNRRGAADRLWQSTSATCLRRVFLQSANVSNGDARGNLGRGTGFAATSRAGFSFAGHSARRQAPGGRDQDLSWARSACDSTPRRRRVRSTTSSTTTCRTATTIKRSSTTSNKVICSPPAAMTRGSKRSELTHRFPARRKTACRTAVARSPWCAIPTSPIVRHRNSSSIWPTTTCLIVSPQPMNRSTATVFSGRLSRGWMCLDKIAAMPVHDREGFPRTPVEPVVIESISRVK